VSWPLIVAEQEEHVERFFLFRRLEVREKPATILGLLVPGDDPNHRPGHAGHG